MTVDLMPEWTIGDLALTSYPYGVDADSTVDIGEPEMVVESVQSMLADGDLERVTRYGNRTYSLEIYIEGATLGDVAASEAALRSELRRTGLTLTHDPGDGFSPASVYEVLTAQLTPERNDTHESHLIRKFTLTLRCGPHALSADKVTVAAVESSSLAPTVVDDCSSATGWTVKINGFTSAPASSSGTLSAQDSTSPKLVEMSRAGTVDFTAARYLVVQMATNAVQPAAYALVGGTAVAFPLVSVRLLPSGWLQTVFDTGGVVVTSLTFVASGAVYGSAAAPTYLNIDQVAKSAALPALTARQLSRVIGNVGTERTPATIHVASTNPAAGLGLTIVHTSPETGSGYSPPLRRWRVSGNAVTTASDTFSGAFEPIHASAVVFEVPVAAVPPGEYALCAALKTDTPSEYAIDWTAETRMASSMSGTAPFTGSTPVRFYDNVNWHFASLTPLTLPTMTASAGSFVRISIRFAGVQPPTIILDDAWLFRVGDDCAISVVNTAPQHVWLDSPTVASGGPEVLVSTAADRSDQWHPGISLFSGGTHVLAAGETALFTATRSFDNPAASAEYYPRWHSNAAL